MNKVKKTAKNYGEVDGKRTLVSEQTFYQIVLDESSDEMSEAEVNAFVRKGYGSWKYIAFCFNRGHDLELRKNVRVATTAVMSKKTMQQIVNSYFMEKMISTALGKTIHETILSTEGGKALTQAYEGIYRANEDELWKWWNERKSEETPPETPLDAEAVVEIIAEATEDARGE